MSRALLKAVTTSTAIVLSVSLVVGCASIGSFREQRTVRQVIERYNRLLADGYRNFNMTPMRSVATSLQAEDEYIHMSSLAEGGVRLDSDLRVLEFVRVSVETTTARAETRETWDYRQYSRADGSLVLTQEGQFYHLAWDLIRQPDGRWLVSDVRAISATATAAPSRAGTITPVPSPNF
jgi:hypothetical protein